MAGSEQQVETAQENTGTGMPPVLLCTHCGGGFSVWLWQPRLRCPHCRMLGYPDRALHNLLPLDWDCPNCGAANSVTTNFCVTCGTGLTSRCLRCERPVYTAICPHCGAHQAAMLRYQIAQTRRVIWEPIVRARIQEQQVQAQAAQTAPAVPPEQAADKSARQVQPKRQERSKSRLVWGAAFIVLGFVLLERQGVISFSQLFSSIVSGISLPTWMVDIGNWLVGWWAAFTPTLDQLADLTTEDPRYLYLFATVVIGMATLPLLFYLIDRLTRRLFP